jgi:flavin reductase (DIM6/NTAB) family NADH-FMN oxidoreductase RutF
MTTRLPLPPARRAGPASGSGPGAEEFCDFMRHWPTGVAVVTTVAGDRPMGCTVNAMMSVSLSPPLLVVALAEASATLAAIRRSGVFCLNLLAAHQRDLCQRFARGSQEDRFRGLAYRSRHRLPVLSGVVAAGVCTAWDITPCGDHALVVGAPVWFGTGAHGSPLVFHGRGYHGLPCVPEVAAC